MNENNVVVFFHLSSAFGHFILSRYFTEGG